MVILLSLDDDRKELLSLMARDRYSVAFLALLLILLTGCQIMNQNPLATVGHVDLERYMGDWYVIASIPTLFEKDAYNAIESYRLNADGTVATTFTFHQGGFNGPLKRYTPTGYVDDSGSNAVWGMQFVWPIKADYRVMYLSEDYGLTIVGRKKRDYVWIMARTPEISEAEYESSVQFVANQGYDVSQMRKVPQRWEPDKAN